MVETPKTICVKCRYHLSEHGPAPEVWHNHRCGHERAVETRFDYTLGKTESEFKFCRDMNPDGACSHYREA